MNVLIITAENDNIKISRVFVCYGRIGLLTRIYFAFAQKCTLSVSDIVAVHFFCCAPGRRYTAKCNFSNIVVAFLDTL